VRNWLFGREEAAVSLQAMFERFAERIRLPLLLEPTYLKEVVRLGIRTKEWLYYDQRANLAYGSDEHVADIVIDDEHWLMLPAEVQRRGIPLLTREPPPQPPEPRGQGPGAAPSPVTAPPASALPETNGDPGLALAELAARAKDARCSSIASLELFWQGEGQDTLARLSALRTILGHLPHVRARVKVDLAVRYPEGDEWEANFKGSAERYGFLAPILEAQAGQAREAHVNVTLGIEFPSGLAVDGPDYRDLRDVLNLAGLGHIRISARPLTGGRP
jgi:hypothetical protein